MLNLALTRPKIRKPERVIGKDNRVGCRRTLLDAVVRAKAIDDPALALQDVVVEARELLGRRPPPAGLSLERVDMKDSDTKPNAQLLA